MSIKQLTVDEETRQSERVLSELRTIVQVKEPSEETWKEITKVKTVSKTGAGFALKRPVAVGRLVTLVMPLDPELRAYDHKAELYPVMGIVQYCNRGLEAGEGIYHVGVGFIGKQIPESFKLDPAQSYRISGMSPDGLWTVTEASSQFKARKDARYWISIDISVTLLQKDKNTVNKEQAVTQNISSSGVSFESNLEVEIGEKVKFACKPLDFYAFAYVRNCKPNKDKHRPPTVHLEFIDAKFPIEKVTLAPTETNKAEVKGGNMMPSHISPQAISHTSVGEIERFG